ncbi:MAG TPA: hypothetical protein VG125_02985 [Pirellulales bacterium]|jgi:hypothetical protein|nr:hypothetical protein [Pirellulales bacterium]
MDKNVKRLTDYLIAEGVNEIGHTNKTYLAHVIGVYRYMEARGCTEELCRAGMFHSIYGTELFQGFKLPLERRPEIAELIGERAERLAYWNCAMDRASFDRALERGQGPYRFLNRLTGEDVELAQQDFDDLCTLHLYDWLEQVGRSSKWEYRRTAYRNLAEHLGGVALRAYREVFSGRLYA